MWAAFYDGCIFPTSERIVKPQRAVFLELEVAHVVITRAGVVEAGIEEQVGRDVLRHLQRNQVFPLY